MNVVKLVKSFGYALRGIWTAIAHQQNMQVHLVAAIVVIVGGLYFNVTLIEWCMLVLVIGLVLTAEVINSSIETLTDLVQPEFHPLAGKLKDMAAGAVLISSITAAVVGILIFGKYLLNL